MNRTQRRREVVFLQDLGIQGAADMGGLEFFCTRIQAAEGNIDLLDVAMEAGPSNSHKYSLDLRLKNEASTSFSLVVSGLKTETDELRRV